MIDCIVRRVELKEKLAFFLSFFSDNKAALVSRKEMNVGIETERETLDDLIALSKKEREKKKRTDEDESLPGQD